MSIESQFSAEEIQALLSGEAVSFSKSSKTPKTKSINEETPSDASSPTVFTPKTSVHIGKVAKVTAPNVRDAEGNVVSEAGTIITPNFSEESPLAKNEKERLGAAKAAKAAEAELAQVSDPLHLLNQLNGLRRIVDKQSKEIAALKKGTKG